jgi:hypothetical protein
MPECCRNLVDGVSFLLQFESVFSVTIISIQPYLSTLSAWCYGWYLNILELDLMAQFSAVLCHCRHVEV